MAVELWQAARPKGKPPRWAFRVTVGEILVFDSAWVSVRYQTRPDAGWLAGLIDRLSERGLFAGCPGHPGQVPPLFNWTGVGDDSACQTGGVGCHIEHMSGPMWGGRWYCAVGGEEVQYFHTADLGVEPRSGPAAWWVCEVITCAVLAGVWEAYPMPPLF